MVEALAKTKDLYKVDVAKFGQQLKINNYGVWKKYRENWDEQFSKSGTQVEEGTLRIALNGAWWWLIADYA